jgi:hypothetical protein
MSPLVDPKVYDLAELFVDDTLAEAPTPRTVSALQRLTYIHRAAEAMQRAIEGECSDIEADLIREAR